MKPLDPSMMETPEEPVCGTAEAARLLGVSTTTIQIMARRGELNAWRTRGGHRRISLASIEKVTQARKTRTRAETRSGLLSVLIAEDDTGFRALYEATFEKWGLPLTLQCASDGFDALLRIERYRPDVLITDLFMQPMDGFKLLQTIRARAEFNEMVILVISGQSAQAIAEQGGLPKGVGIFPKPVSFEKLRGFIEAAILRKQLAVA